MGSQRTGPSMIRREHSGSKRSQPLRYQCTCTSACGQSLLNPNAETRSAEKTKTDKYKLLCQQRGMDFVPIIFTTSGGMWEQFQH